MSQQIVIFNEKNFPHFFLYLHTDIFFRDIIELRKETKHRKVVAMNENEKKRELYVCVILFCGKAGKCIEIIELWEELVDYAQYIEFWKVHGFDWQGDSFGPWFDLDARIIHVTQ